ncbi:MAG: NADH-quinone oxidoreductase subunit NuoH [Spirochaetia bacterium]|nr:NADH-quinone oxidoreductase subunit NuoH [Spirochaetia bacterium]
MGEEIIIAIIKLLIFFFAMFTAAAYTTLAERKIMSYMQLRKGPNRAGPWGFLQPLADGIKFIFKEEIVPAHTDNKLFILGPLLMIAVSLMPWVAIPFGDKITIFGREVYMQLVDINTGALFMISISSLGVYGIILGGWASNNKFSLMGAVRASAQMISYELPLGLSLAAIFILSGTIGTRDIILKQIESPWQWNIFVQPLGFIIFFTSMLAETNRTPFDLAECDSELLAGYHTEYGGFKFSLFLFGEYINIITASAFMAVLYLGGWSIPFVNLHDLGLSDNLIGIISVFVVLAKTAFFVFVFIWVRWTLPRFRYDQLMDLGWKMLLPLSIVNLMITAAVVLFV